MWCYYFCAGIFVSINGWKKWDELVGQIFIWAVYSVDFALLEINGGLRNIWPKSVDQAELGPFTNGPWC